MRTTVKSWFSDKKYGFLKNGDGAAPDIIVHVSELKNCTFLKPGRSVEFECHINEKGLVAKNVTLVYDSEEATAQTRKHDSRIVTINGWNQVGKPRYNR